MTSLDFLRKRHDELQNGGKANSEDILGKYYQPKLGINDVRILPGEEDEARFFSETKIHRVPSGNGTKNVHCLKIHGKACPLCDVYFGLWKMHNALNLGKDKNSMYSQRARQIRATERFYMNVLVRETGEVKILSVGKKLMDKILSDLLELDSLKNPIFMLDVSDGIDFKIEMTKNGVYNDYSRSGVRKDSSPVSEKAAEVASILAQRHDLEELVRLEDECEVRKLADEYLAVTTGSSAQVEGDDDDSDDSNEYLKSLKNRLNGGN